MSGKNPFWGLKCESCDQVYTHEYLNDPKYTFSSCHESILGRKMFTCGKCNENSIQEMNAHRKLKKGIGRVNEQLV